MYVSLPPWIVRHSSDPRETNDFLGGESLLRIERRSVCAPQCGVCCFVLLNRYWGIVMYGPVASSWASPGRRGSLRKGQGNGNKRNVTFTVRERRRICHWNWKLRIVPQILRYPPEKLSFQFSTNSGLQVSFWRKKHILEYPMPLP